MKLHILSDLHLEVSQYRPHSFADQADVIVVPGDVWKRDHGIYMLRSMWPDKVIVNVAGNHEFYNTDIHENLERMRVAAKETGVNFLENDEAMIEIDGERVRFLGATLWTDFRLYGDTNRHNCMVDGGRALNDFRLIRNGEWNFSPADSIEMHNESVRWLEMKLKKEPFDGPTVVVTHHAPSFGSVVPRYQHDMLSACFASRLNHLLGFSELWIHGHMHDSLDYMLEGTRVICNPRGYCRYEGGEENDDFNPALIVDVTPGKVEIVVPPEGLPEPREVLPKMSARQRDAAIWAIDGLEVKTHAMDSMDLQYVDLWALRPDLRQHVREIVLTHDVLVKSIPDHLAIMPLPAWSIEWLIEELIKRAPATKRAPKRRIKP